MLVFVDFDQSSLKALVLAAKIAQQHDGTISVLLIVPVDLDMRGMFQCVDLIKRQESLDREKLNSIAKEQLADAKWELLDEMGPPAAVITEVAAKLSADLVIMVMHGRRGLARLVEGSVAEKVLRNAPCPLLANPSRLIGDGRPAGAKDIHPAEVAALRPEQPRIRRCGIHTPTRAKVNAALDGINRRNA